MHVGPRVAGRCLPCVPAPRWLGPTAEMPRGLWLTTWSMAEKSWGARPSLYSVVTLIVGYLRRTLVRRSCLTSAQTFTSASRTSLKSLTRLGRRYPCPTTAMPGMLRFPSATRQLPRSVSATAAARRHVAVPRLGPCTCGKPAVRSRPEGIHRCATARAQRPACGLCARFYAIMLRT